MFTEGCDKSSPGQNVPGLNNITTWKKYTNDLISATKFPRNLLLFLQKHDHQRTLNTSWNKQILSVFQMCSNHYDRNLLFSIRWVQFTPFRIVQTNATTNLSSASWPQCFYPKYSRPLEPSTLTDDRFATASLDTPMYVIAVSILTLVRSSVTSKYCLQTSWFLTYLTRRTSWNFRKNQYFCICVSQVEILSWLILSEINKNVLKLSMQLFNIKI